MRILTLLLRYGSTKYPAAEVEIDRIFSAQEPRVERSTVLVDSALPVDYVQRLGANRTLIGADNTFSEWSAADAGIAFLGNEIWSYDLVHLATAAFNTLYTRYLERIETRLLEAVVDRSCCLGHIDCYNEPIRVLSYRSQHWVRTSFVFLRPVELKALRTLVPFAEPARLFSGDPTEPFRGDAPLSEQYKTYILDWLVGDDIGQGVTWHSGFRLGPETLATFERKALAIINEHLLSIRLRALDCPLIDVTWLATQLGRVESVRIPWRLDWRTQLAERDADAIELAEPTQVPPPTVSGQARK